MSNRIADKQAMNVVVFVKGEERYIFLFDDDNRAEALRTLGRFASDPELSFNWNDAAKVSRQLMKLLCPSQIHAD